MSVIHCHTPDFLSPHRKLLSYLLIPVIRCQLDVFQETVWNSHRIRSQKSTMLPDGTPDHVLLSAFSSHPIKVSRLLTCPLCYHLTLYLWFL